MNCDNKLKELAPIFLQHMHGDPAVTCMAWGCECGDGWEQPITDMCTKLEELNNAGDGQHVIADQIKSKYAELTVYWHTEDTADHTEEQQADFVEKAGCIINDATVSCSNTCELCGAPATQVTSGWWTLVCDACMEKRMQERAWKPNTSSQESQ